MNATVEATVRFATHIEDSAGAPADGSHAGSVYRARGPRGREACELTGTTTRSLEFPLDADVDVEEQVVPRIEREDTLVDAPEPLIVVDDESRGRKVVKP